MFRFSGHIALIVLAAASLTACDSATEVVEEPVVTATVEVPLEDQIVGLWERDIAQTTVGWLFKEGGVFQVGEPRPFFPVVGNWSLHGDTLQVTDPGSSIAVSTSSESMRMASRRRHSTIPAVAGN